MELQTAIERISELLDDGELETSNTSMRIPTALRDAAALAVKELGIAPSATALTTAALRATLDTNVIRKRVPTLVIWLSRPRNSTAIHWRASLGGCARQPPR